MKNTEINELVRYCLDECGVPSVPFDVVYNNRYTAKVASAQFKWNVGIITLSTKWWGILTDTEKENTIVHEACHLAASKLDRNRVIREGLQGHGTFWQSLHLKCGRPPERYCSRPREQVAPNSRYILTCRKCGHQYKVSKTLITRRLNNHGIVGNCGECKSKLFPPQKYIKDMSDYQFNDMFGLNKGTSYYTDLVTIRGT